MKKRPLDERIAIHREWAKTARCLIVTAGIVGSLWVIVRGMVDLADTPVIAALKILLPTIFSAGIPTYAFYVYGGRVRQFTAGRVARQSKFEKELDPGRTSSDLREDGTDPPGGLT